MTLRVHVDGAMKTALNDADTIHQYRHRESLERLEWALAIYQLTPCTEWEHPVREAKMFNLKTYIELKGGGQRPVDHRGKFIL